MKKNLYRSVNHAKAANAVDVVAVVVVEVKTVAEEMVNVVVAATGNVVVVAMANVVVVAMVNVVVAVDAVEEVSRLGMLLKVVLKKIPIS